jgi:hypothetical protein
LLINRDARKEPPQCSGLESEPAAHRRSSEKRPHPGAIFWRQCVAINTLARQQWHLEVRLLFFTSVEVGKIPPPPIPVCTATAENQVTGIGESGFKSLRRQGLRKFSKGVTGRPGGRRRLDNHFAALPGRWAASFSFS